MKIKRLSNKELRILSEKTISFGIHFKKGDEVYSVGVNDKDCLVMNRQVIFFYYNTKLIPSLSFLINHDSVSSNIKRVVVDMGAVRFVVKGADIMRPGIIEFDDFLKDECVVIVDINNKRPLAIGITLYDNKEMNKITKGRVIKNIHFIGDKIWNFNR